MQLQLELDDHAQACLGYILAAHKDAARELGQPTSTISVGALLGELASREFLTVRRAWPKPTAESMLEAEDQLVAVELLGEQFHQLVNRDPLRPLYGLLRNVHPGWTAPWVLPAWPPGPVP